MLRPSQSYLVIGLMYLALMPGLAHGQPVSERPRFHGLALGLRYVATSELTGHTSVPDMIDPSVPHFENVEFQENGAHGWGLDVAYILDHGVAPFISADFYVQSIRGQFGGFGAYGTVAAGVRVRRPLSRRVVPFAQVSVARLRLSAPAYTQPYLGGGMEFFLGRRTALSAALELPVAGSSELDTRPRRFVLGTTWYLGH